MPILPPTSGLNPLDAAVGVDAVDYSADFDSLYKRINNVQKFFEKGTPPGNLVKYIPDLAKPIYQGQIAGPVEKKAYAEDSYRDLKVAMFMIQLSTNQYMNFNNVHLVFPLKIKKKNDDANNIDDEEITVNNFFVHWIKEIDIKRYGDDIPVVPLTNTVEVYKYSDAMLKHMLDDALDVVQYELLYSNKKVQIRGNRDRRQHRKAAGVNANVRTDDNVEDRIAKFQNQIQTTKYYRIPLKYLCNLGLVNQPIRFNTQWRITFETNMQKLFESKENQAAGAAIPNSVDAKIILELAPYILYHQFELEDTFRTYPEGTTISENNLRTGIRKTSLQKSYEMSVGSVTFNNAFKQFSFLEISLVYEKSDQYLSIYDSYNAEIASTHNDLTDSEDQYTLHNAFTERICDGSSIVPQSDYAYNKTYHGLPKIDKYFSEVDERVYIDIKRSKGYTGELERINRDDSDLTVTVELKAAATSALRLGITGYFQGEYMYMLNKDGLVMNCKEYGVNKQKSLAQ